MVYKVHTDIYITTKDKREVTIKDKVISAEFTEDVESISQSGSITVSKFLHSGGVYLFECYSSVVFKSGDPIIYHQYYEDDLDNKFVFEGYIARVDVKDDTATIHVEDYGYILKRDNYTAADVKLINENVKLDPKFYNLQAILRLIRSNTKDKFGVSIDFEIPSFELDIPSFRVQAGATSMSILDMIKSKFGITIFLTNNTIIVGAAYEHDIVQQQLDAKKIKQHIFSCLPADIPEGSDPVYPIIEQKLVWQTQDDIRLRLEVQVFKAGQVSGKKKVYGISEDDDKNVEVRQLILVGDYTDEQIEKIAYSTINRYRYTGFARGSSIRICGIPQMSIYDVAVLDGYTPISNLHDNNATMPRYSFMVNKIVTGLNSSDGFYRDVYVGNKVNTTKDKEASSVDKYIKQLTTAQQPTKTINSDLNVNQPDAQLIDYQQLNKTSKVKVTVSPEININQYLDNYATILNKIFNVQIEGTIDSNTNYPTIPSPNPYPYIITIYNYRQEITYYASSGTKIEKNTGNEKINDTPFFTDKRNIGFKYLYYISTIKNYFFKSFSGIVFKIGSNTYTTSVKAIKSKDTIPFFTNNNINFGGELHNMLVHDYYSNYPEIQIQKKNGVNITNVTELTDLEKYAIFELNTSVKTNKALYYTTIRKMYNLLLGEIFNKLDPQILNSGVTTEEFINELKTKAYNEKINIYSQSTPSAMYDFLFEYYSNIK